MTRYSQIQNSAHLAVRSHAGPRNSRLRWGFANGAMNPPKYTPKMAPVLDFMG